MKTASHIYRFQFQITRRHLSLFLSAAFVILLIEPIATENITLSTYYPAPAGSYSNLVTIGNTWLARDNIPGTPTPSFVELGSNAAVSPGTKLAVMNGNVGIGTNSPQASLDVEPGGGCNTFCNSNGCHTTCPSVLRLGLPGGGINPNLPGDVWTAQDQYGDGGWNSPPSLSCLTVGDTSGSGSAMEMNNPNGISIYCPSGYQVIGTSCDYYFNGSGSLPGTGSMQCETNTSNNSGWCNFNDAGSGPNTGCSVESVCCQMH